MASDQSTVPDRRREIGEALRLWQASDQQGAIERLRALADAGDVAAAIPLVQFLWGMPPNWQGGIRYARQVAEAGVPHPFLVNYINNMLVEPGLRAEGLELARLSVPLGLPVDLLGPAQNAASQGDPESAAEMMEISALPAASAAQATWQQIVMDARGQLDAIRSHEAEAARAKETTAASLAEHEAAIQSERERVGVIVDQVDALVHAATSDQLAKEYAEQATREETLARRYTVAALAVAGLTALVTLAVAGLLVFGDYDVENVLTKASLAIPLLAFAAYVGKLAADHRRMAWHWRHVELQIRTADPFIAPLEDAPRKALLAALALRLFPGQPQDPQRGGPEAPDPTDFLTQLAKSPAPPAE